MGLLSNIFLMPYKRPYTEIKKATEDIKSSLSDLKKGNLAENQIKRTYDQAVQAQAEIRFEHNRSILKTHPRRILLGKVFFWLAVVGTGFELLFWIAKTILLEQMQALTSLGAVPFLLSMLVLSWAWVRGNRAEIHRAEQELSLNVIIDFEAERAEKVRGLYFSKRIVLGLAASLILLLVYLFLNGQIFSSLICAGLVYLCLLSALKMSLQSYQLEQRRIMGVAAFLKECGWVHVLDFTGAPNVPLSNHHSSGGARGGQ